MGPPDGEQSSVLPPRKILSCVCDGEERLWNQRDLSENADDLSSSASSDISSKLIRSGKTVKKIHTYFGNLEPRKCCLFLAGCKTTFNNVRLVRSDGRDSGIEEGAMRKMPHDTASDITELDEIDLRVFRRAYMCASYPVLCVPEPPPALTPSPDHISTDDDKRFLFGDTTDIPRMASPDNMQDSGVEEVEDMSIVPAETLFELLRRAYRLGQDKFNRYEVAIFHQYGKKESSKILAEELVSQLAALENNNNPFYNPDRFTTPQAYDNWQRREFSHIAELMKKFWSSAYPQHSNTYVKTLQTAHIDYKLLMEKLLRYESPYRIEGELHAPGPFSPLSSASVRLLREFGLRYGIGELYRKLVYLQYLINHFDPTVSFIQHTCATLMAVIDILPTSGGRNMMVDKEYEVFEEILKGLDTRAGTTIFKMKTLFPNNRPSDGLETLIDLIKLTQKGKTLLTNGKATGITEFLLHHTQNIFPTCYNEHKMVAMRDLKQNEQRITPTLLNMMIGKLRDELRDYLCNYHSTFDKYFNITEMAAQTLYSLLMDDVIRLFQNRQEYPKKMMIDKKMLGLGYRLKQLDNDWSKYIPSESQVWREWFHKEQIHWSIVLKITLQYMVIESVSEDKFRSETLHVKPFIMTPGSSLSDHRNRSISVTPSLTISLTSAFSGLPSSCQSTPEHPIYKTQPSTVHQQDIVSSNLQSNPKMPSTMGTEYSSAQPVISAFQSVTKKNKHVLGTSKTDPILINNFKDSTAYSHDTQSLVEFEDEDSVMVFGGIRRGSSMPEMLSKSFDHHLKISRQKLRFQHLSDNHNDTDMVKNYNGDVDRLDSLETEVQVNGIQKQNSAEMKSVHEETNHNYSSEENTGEIINGNCSDTNTETSTPVQLLNTDETKEKKILEENAQKPVQTKTSEGSDGDKDSLAGEFEGENALVDDVKASCSSDTESDNSYSPETSFPPVSVVSLDNKTFSEDMPNLNSNSMSVPVPTLQTRRDQNNKAVAPTVQVTAKPVITESPKPQLKARPTLSPPANSTDSSHGLLKSRTDAITMVSNSVIDLIVILQRLLGFGMTLCQTFYQALPPRQSDFENSFSSATSMDSAASFHSMESRRKIYDKFLENMCNMFTVYADNILCMDVCGTSLSVAKRLAGAQLIEYLQIQRQSDVIWGCRHDVYGVKNCFEYVNKKSKFLCDRYEPITQDMCTRINDVSVLLSYINVYHKKLGQVFDIMEDWTVNQQGASSSDDNQKEYVTVGSFGYNPKSDQKVVMETGSQRLPVGSVRFSGTSSLVQCPTDNCVKHVMAALRAQSRFMAYRINLFIHDALCVLLALRDADTPISTCLRPLSQFMASYVESLQKWLYPDNYRRVMECLWIFIVQDFEEELEKLKRNESSDTNAHLLIQALTHLMRFMNNEDRGIRRKLLLPQAETVMFKLQLYAAPSSCLILLYRKLLELYFSSEVSSTCTTDNTIHMILQKIRQDLLEYRKCFSGSQLVTWIGENPSLFSVLDPTLNASDISQRRETCTFLAQSLADLGLVVDVDASEEHNDLDDTDFSDEDYPELSLMGNFQPFRTRKSLDTEANFDDDDDNTPTVTPRTTPVPKNSQNLNTSVRGHLKKTDSSRHRGTRSLNSTPRNTPVPKTSVKSSGHATNVRSHGHFNKSLSQNEGQRQKTNADTINSLLNDQNNPADITSAEKLDEQESNDTFKTRKDVDHFNFLQSTSLSPSSDFEGERFQDSRSHFYRIVTFTNSSVHTRSEGVGDSEELSVLVEQCFQMKIVPEFVKEILFSRRKHDLVARQYILKESEISGRAFVYNENGQRCDIS